jgi:small subunit ribosomal protein S1
MTESQPESMADFSALIDAQLNAFRRGFDPGEKVEGVVTGLGPEFVIVDLNAKREGVLPREAVLDESGALNVAVGDPITAYFVGMRDGAFLLSLSLSGVAAQQSLREAVAQDLPVEGVVTGEIKGGFEVSIGGQRGFCPYSQIDVIRREAPDYIGQRLQFLVTEFDEQAHNVVLSRRNLIERERAATREELRATLAEGDVRAGTVARITEFGVFVDLGGIDGLIPMRELAWERDVDPASLVAVGDAVTVLVQRVDWEQERIALSLRYASGNPWEQIEARHPVGCTRRVTVTRLMPFGAFAELEPGIEGLIHISRLGAGRRLQHPREAVAEGDEIEVQIEAIDTAQQRIALKPIDARMQALSAANVIEPGAYVTGVVEGHREFGVFLKLTETQTGLLHVSELDVPRGGNVLGQLERAYPLGMDVPVVVKSIEGRRLSLTLPARWEAEHAPADTGPAPGPAQPDNGRSFGSLADAFNGLKL